MGIIQSIITKNKEKVAHEMICVIVLLHKLIMESFSDVQITKLTDAHIREK